LSQAIPLRASEFQSFLPKQETRIKGGSLPNRRRTPMIMLSGEECETEAWRAGVNDFLRKPKDIDHVPATIARLLNITLKNK